MARGCGSVWYVPSAVTWIAPVHTGVPEHATAFRAGNGPYSAAWTVTCSPHSPVTVTVSLTDPSAASDLALTTVCTVGWAWTRTRSVGALHGVVNPMWFASDGAISWYW